MPDFSGLTLREDGDSFEHEWAGDVLDGFDVYEDFWRRHVAPLSFRARQPDNYFIRPSLPSHLIDLANSAYAVFYHLAHCHYYEKQLVFVSEPKDFPRPTEYLYCFFAHARSSHDALLHLCSAAARCTKKYGVAVDFDFITGQNPRHIFALRGCESSLGIAEPDLASYKRLSRRLDDYRNLMIHEKPIFLQSSRLPKPEHVEEYSGLTAIGMLAKNPSAQDEHYRPIDEALAECIALLKDVSRELVAYCLVHLDELTETDYPKDQSRFEDGDQKLKIREFLKQRER